MSRQAFFFPHALEPKQARDSENSTGRVAYLVEASLLGPSGGAVKRGPCVVMADGFVDPNTGVGLVGPNQDPCVFSDPNPPFHSFCRIDGANLANEKVVGDGKHIADSLPEVVKPGDVIVYGKTIPPSGKAIKEVWVDTVLVVDSVVDLETDSSTPKGPWPFPLASTSVLGKEGSDAYRFNLSDGGPKGMHATTARNPHRIIRGRVATTANAVADLKTSFVPLADTRGGISRVCAVDKGHLRERWPELVEFFQQQVYARIKGVPHGGWIAKFDDFTLAEALLSAIVARSGGEQRSDLRGVVAIPPLKPVGTIKRWDPRSKRVT